jgi:hypothetical protein
MLRRSLLFAMAAALAFVFLTMPSISQAQPANNLPDASDNHFWGTWVHNVEGMPVPALITIHSDGTLYGSAGFMFGFGNQNMRLSPIHGVWEKTGPKSIAATSIFLVFDGNGYITGYQRNRCTLNYDKGLDSYTGVEFMEITSCGAQGCPNPLDPATVWTPFYFMGMPPAGYPVSGGRLKMVLPPAQ